MIEDQIRELEKMQNELLNENESLKKLTEKLSEENQSLRMQMSLETEKLSETAASLNNRPRLNHSLDKEEESGLTDAVLGLMESTQKLTEIEEFSTKLVQIVKSIIKGEEPPIELILQHNRGAQSKTPSEPLRKNCGKREFILLIRENNLTLNRVYGTFQRCMDTVCELYAIKYGISCLFN